MKHIPLPPGFSHFAVCSLLLAVSAALGLLFYSIGFGEANIIMVFLLAVLLISVTCGRTVGIIASLVSVIIFNFLFTQPRFTLVVHDTQYIITFLVMFFVAVITSELTNRMKREAGESHKRAGRMEKLYRTSRNFLRKSGTVAVIDTALQSLYEQLHIPVGCILYQGEHKHFYGIPEFEDNETVIHKHYLSTPDTSDYSERRLPELNAYYYPLKSAEQILGVIILRNSEIEIDSEQRGLVEAVSAQLILALDRERLSKKQENTRMEIERERLRSDLLRSISHDLRTPLTSITGASTTLLEEKGLPSSHRRKLIESIRSDASWLTQLVENLLSLTKVESGVSLTKEAELVEDVLVDAVEKCRNRTHGRTIHAELPEKPIIVPMDPNLIHQVLVNLIDNALRYSPKNTDVATRTYISKDGSYAVFEVEDSGPGIPVEEQERIFSRFYTLRKSTADGRRGLGLGLSICKAIVEAHEGIIQVEKKSKGSIFRFFIPAENNPHYAEEL